MNNNQPDASSGPPSPASSIGLDPMASYSPISMTSSSPSKRAREASTESDADSTMQHYNRPSPMTYDIDDDEQLENAVAGWDCNDKDTLAGPEIPDLSPVEQLDHIEGLKNDALVDGHTWYLVSMTWISRWKQYCKRMSSPSTNTQLLGSQTAPGAVDNSSILNDRSQLLPNLEEDEDYICVPELAWLSLEKWYGVSDSTVPRYVITQGEFVKESCIEVYPPTFKVYLAAANQAMTTSLEKCPSITLSRTTSVQDMKQTLLNAFDLAQDIAFELWRLDDDLPTTLNTSPIVSSSVLRDAEKINTDQGEKTISDLSLSSGTLVMELATPTTTTSNFINSTSGDLQAASSNSPSNSSTSSIFGTGFNNLTTNNNDYSDDSMSGLSWMSKTTPVSRQKGTCGLNNLGNTCFMNSALQCLSNTMQLTKWFLAGNYKQDLNRDNPLGMNGEIAENYGALIEKLWSGSSTSVAPRDFKYTIGRFNPTFTGYQQHDSQELLAFLLDGLHEDMNRILKKPYIEMPDFDDMTDEEIAKTSWDYHKARNDSVIVDLFQGQFKSRLICNVCHKVSVTFDPFMYLSLPLPIQKKRKTQLVYVPYDPSVTPQRMTITLDKDASFKHLKDAVAKQVDVQDPSTLLIVEVFNHKIYKVFQEYELIASIGLSDVIYVYQLPGPAPSLPPSSKRRPRFGFRSRLGSSAFDADDDNDAAQEEKDFDGEKWIVFPVYCATTNSDTQYSYEQFGGPILLSIQAKDATCPENVYRLIAKHVERYTMMKLFEEVRRPSQASITTDNPTSSPSADTDVDMVEQQQAKPIRTAAAVTAAGGRQLEPISNLFSMKLFSENSYSSNFDSLIPTGISSWRSGSLDDLNERYIKECDERDAYEKAKHASKVDLDEPMDDRKDNTAPSTPQQQQPPIDDYEDEVVEDMAAEWNRDSTTAEEAVEANSTTDNSSDDDDEGSTNSSMIFEDSNTKPNKSAIQSSLSPTTSSVSSSTSSPPPAIAPRHPPPRTVIRQGEGILLDWRLKKAQEVFGTNGSSSYGNSDVNDAGWKEIDQVADPNAETDEKKTNKKVTLMDCMDEFTKEEELSEEDLWYCPQCKQHQRATKKFDIWHLPEIMVVHLKRFSHTRTLRDKIDALIDFPMEALDMTDRVLGVQDAKALAPEDRFVYDLYAVDNHFGGLGGGHYTAYAQNWQDGEWYNFDDSHVSKIEQKDAKTNAAYLLFYKRRRQVADPEEQPVAAEEQPAVTEEHPVDAEEHPTVTEEQPAAAEEQPAAAEEQPTANGIAETAS